MLDLAFVRANLPLVEEKLRARGMDHASISNVSNLELLDRKRRDAITEVENLKARRNRITEEIATMRRAGGDVQSLTEETRALKTEADKLQDDANELDGLVRAILEAIPNLPQDSVPPGSSGKDNRIEKVWDSDEKLDLTGQPNTAYTPAGPGFALQPHWKIGERLGILDFNRAAKISGSRFVVHYGQGARLERALANFMLDLHTSKHGYTEVLPPYMVNSKSLFGTGQLPKFEEDLFYCVNRRDLRIDPEALPDDSDENFQAKQSELERINRLVKGGYQDSDHWLIPTAEVPVTNLFRDEILDESQLTISFCAYTPCFRSEAGSYGKDVRGMIRQHQFQKVELVKFTTPDRSNAEHERLTRDAERVLELLGLPYRRMLLCTGDMGFSSARTYDLEVWLPGQQLYREISSCSNFESFQARRANIRFRPAGQKKSEFVHTLNGSGLAVGRTYLAILENYQQPDGTVRIPEALVPYMNNETLITKRS